MSVQHSTTALLLSAVLGRGKAALSGSRFVRGARNAGREIACVTTQSQAAELVRGGEKAIRASGLFRWLTAEPEPDVIVIDLRETIVVGPILDLLERLLAPFVRNWDHARAARIVARLSDRFATKPVAVASTVALVAIISNLLILVAFGLPTHRAVGIRLGALSLALAGTRITASADELTESPVYDFLVALLAPPEPPDRNERDDHRESATQGLQPDEE